MIPILYDKTETAFTSEGLGRLASASRCIVTEERNGVYELELDYPVTGDRFDDIEVGRIIFATHDDGGDGQPFDIYKKSEPINGVVTFYGHHISYRLNEITVMPFTAASCAEAIAGISTNSIGTNPFTFSTDKSVTAAYKVSTPSQARGLLGGQENSILDVYGKGEYLFDKWSVTLMTNRGTTKSTSIRYGKNIVDYTNEYDDSDAYTAVAPYWFGQVSEDDAEPSDTLVTLPEKYISSGHSTSAGREIIAPLDMSSDFQDKPTVVQLRAAATARLTASDAWIPSQTINVDFEALWQTEEYAEVAPLQSVKLCDTVNIDMTLYGTHYRAKVIKTVYNTLLDRYDNIELGDKPDTYAQAITSGLGQTFTDLTQKIAAADAKATWAATVGGDENQHFWFKGTAGTGTYRTTGAHITEKEQDEFIADPSNGGGNLLARTDGVAVRDGLREIAAFGDDGIFLNNKDDVPIMRVEAASNNIRTFCADGPFYNSLGNEGTATKASIRTTPNTAETISLMLESANNFTFTYGTADTQSSEHIHGDAQLKHTVEYDGDLTFLAYVQQRSNPQEEYSAPEPARIITIYYYANTYQPLYTVGSSVGERGGFSSTFGEGLMAQSPYQVAVGMFNDNNTDNMFEVGGGTDNDTRLNYFWVDGDGYANALSGLNTNGVLNVGGQATVTGNVIGGGLLSKKGSAANISGHFRPDACYAIECRPSANRTLTTSQAHIPTPTAVFSGGGNWLTLNSGGTITVKGACYVMAWAYLYVTGATEGDAMYLYIEKNGTAQATYYQRHPYSNQTISVPQKLIQCAANDVLRVTCRNSTAARGTVQASSFSCFGVKVISPI